MKNVNKKKKKKKLVVKKSLHAPRAPTALLTKIKITHHRFIGDGCILEGISLMNAS